MIWLTELDMAWKLFIENTIKVSNGKGKYIFEVGDDEVAVRILNPDYATSIPKVLSATPDKDAVSMTFPCVSFEQYMMRPNFDRQTYETEILAINEDSIDSSRPSVEYDMWYRVDIYAQYKSQLNEMESSWVSKTPRHFLLKVVNSDGVEEEVPVLQYDYAKHDYLKKETRYYHRTYYYKVWAYIEDSNVINTPFNEIVIRGQNGNS
jgi:hypothetical protein